MRAKAETWLQEILGEGAHFRDGQWEAIQALVEDRQRVLVVQRTGWGKSMVYFLATRLLREQGAGVTLLISPLLALMRNQIASATYWGITAATVNSTNPEEHVAIEYQLHENELDLLLISPERLSNDRFQHGVWQRLKKQVGLVVVDEAHCISDWGHDFRPDYRRIIRLLDQLPPQTPVLGTTATANNRVVQDVGAILGAGMNIQRGGLTRESLLLYVYPEPQEHAQRLALLAHLMRTIAGSGIIYCTTTRDCVVVAEWLQAQGPNVMPYYSGIEEDFKVKREDLEQQLLNNELKALVASVALGMGFDKPDLSFVIHYQQPGNIISYYQQIGRAGRGIDKAYIILMHGEGDEDIQTHFIKTAFPSPQQVEGVIEALSAHGELTNAEMLRHVNTTRSTLDKILTHLEMSDIIRKNGRGYMLLDANARPNYEHWAAITQQRYDEMAQMQAYIQHDGCLMSFIARALDDPTAVKPCGRCKNCRNSQSKYVQEREALEAAQQFLRKGKPILFEPRKQWAGRSATRPKVKLEALNETGVALCQYHTAGWAESVKQGRFFDNHYADDLVAASAQTLQDYWRIERIKSPQWVTCVPSLRRPQLVLNFSMRLARALNLPFHAIVKQAKPTQLQAELLNSHQKAANVEKAFQLTGQPLTSPVLLIDDVADSRWTLTVIGELLQKAGSGAVHPFVLAYMGYGD